jgi:RNA polymerase sigma-70 factor, ECF subfamily
MDMSTILNAGLWPTPSAARLNQLIRQYSSPVGALLGRLGLAKSDVDDARQQVWLTVARRIEKMHPGSERAFLFSIARREAGHVRRARRRRSEVLGTELDELAGASLPSDEVLERRQLLQRAWTVLREMDQSLSTVLWMSEVDDATSPELAKQLQIPLGTVKSRLRRARLDCARRALTQVPPSPGRCIVSQ